MLGAAIVDKCAPGRINSITPHQNSSLALPPPSPYLPPSPPASLPPPLPPPHPHPHPNFNPSSTLFFQELFPQFANMITDEAYERLALQEVSRLPSFSYTGPLLHLGRSAVLLGTFVFVFCVCLPHLVWFAFVKRCLLLRAYVSVIFFFCLFSLCVSCFFFRFTPFCIFVCLCHFHVFLRYFVLLVLTFFAVYKVTPSSR